MTLGYHPHVEDDLTDAASYYEARSPGLGEDFLAEVRESVDLICDAPNRFPRVEGPVRKSLLRRFPFAIYYRHDLDRVLVLAVMHTRRHPDAWKARLRGSR